MNRGWVMGGLDVAVAVMLLVGVWGFLPARWLPVDAGATLVAMLMGLSGIGFLTGQSWAPKVGRLAAGITLAIGVVLVTTLAFTAGNLSGLYGPVGLGGAAILGLVALLLLPYFVIFPAAQLYFLAPRSQDASSPKPSKEPSKAPLPEASKKADAEEE